MKKQPCNFLDDEGSDHVTDQLEELNKHRRLASPSTQTTCVDTPATMEKNDSQSYFSFNTAACSTEKGSISIPFQSPPPSYQPAMASNDHGLQPSRTTFASNAAITEFHDQLIENLSYGMKKELSLKLDDERPNENNWKDVADYFNISDKEIKSFERNTSHYKFTLVLDSLPCRYPRITVKNLITALKHLGRQDAVFFMQEFFERQRSQQAHFLQAMQSPSRSTFAERYPVSPVAHLEPQNPVTTEGQFVPQISVPPVPNTSLQVNVISSSDDASPSSSSSFNNTERVCPSPNSYDALVFCHRADMNFVLREFLPKIEVEAGLKLCIPERDLAAGNLAYKTQLEAMCKSCRKIIVILSDEFLEDNNSDCSWQLNTAVSVDPSARHGKIIPVIYKPIASTHIVSGLTACDRMKVLEDSWFWNGIIKGIKPPNHNERKRCASMF